MLSPTIHPVVRLYIASTITIISQRDLMMCVGCHQAKLCDFIQVRSTGQFRETRPAPRPERRPTSVRSSYLSPISQIIFAEKKCHVEKFQLSIQNLNNLWSFIKVYAVFVPNLCGEKSAWRKSVWRKNDKYEVWVTL